MRVYVCSNRNCVAVHATDPHGFCPTCFDDAAGVRWSTLHRGVQGIAALTENVSDDMLVEFAFSYLEGIGEAQTRETIREELASDPEKFSIPRRAVAAAIRATLAPPNPIREPVTFPTPP